MSWRVRYEGSETVVELPTAQKVLEGVREGALVRGADDG